MAVVRTKSLKKGYRYKPMVKDAKGAWMRSHTWGRIIDARREESELMRLKDSGAKANTLAPLPFSEAATMWMEDCERRVSKQRRDSVEQFVRNHFLPFFGDRNIKRIKPSDIVEFISVLKDKELAAESINSILRALKAMFNFHIEENNIAMNPIKRKHRVLDNNTKPIIVWTVEEVSKFLEYADKRYQNEDRWMYIYYKIALNTGMRLGEIAALDKADIEYENSRIRVSKSFCASTKEIKAPKNGKTRYAPLPQKLAEEIRQYIIDYRIFGALFLDVHGSYRSTNTIEKRYKRDNEASGVRKTKFHNMRRFFITHYGERGGTEAQLRKIVGHGSVQMTDLYTVQREKLDDISRLVNL